MGTVDVISCSFLIRVYLFIGFFSENEWTTTALFGMGKQTFQGQIQLNTVFEHKINLYSVQFSGLEHFK